MKATEEVAYWLRVFSALLAYRGANFKNALTNYLKRIDDADDGTTAGCRRP
jgi:hypothetical protein